MATTHTYTFVAAAAAAIATVKQDGALWNNLAGWIVTTNIVGANGAEQRKCADGIIKEAAKQYAEANPKATELGKIGAYRSSKSTVLKAIELGVALVDASGKARGKTEVTDEIAALAAVVEKSEIEKFTAVAATLNAIAGKLPTVADLTTAIALVEELYAKLANSKAVAIEVEKEAA